MQKLKISDYIKNPPIFHFLSLDNIEKNSIFTDIQKNIKYIIALMTKDSYLEICIKDNILLYEMINFHKNYGKTVRPLFYDDINIFSMNEELLLKFINHESLQLIQIKNYKFQNDYLLNNNLTIHFNENRDIDTLSYSYQP